MTSPDRSGSFAHGAAAQELRLAAQAYLEPSSADALALLAGEQVKHQTAEQHLDAATRHLNTARAASRAALITILRQLNPAERHALRDLVRRSETIDGLRWRGALQSPGELIAALPTQAALRTAVTREMAKWTTAITILSAEDLIELGTEPQEGQGLWGAWSVPDWRHINWSEPDAPQRWRQRSERFHQTGPRHAPGGSAQARAAFEERQALNELGLMLSPDRRLLIIQAAGPQGWFAATSTAGQRRSWRHFPQPRTAPSANTWRPSDLAEFAQGVLSSVGARTSATSHFDRNALHRLRRCSHPALIALEALQQLTGA